VETAALSQFTKSFVSAKYDARTFFMEILKLSECTLTASGCCFGVSIFDFCFVASKYQDKTPINASIKSNDHFFIRQKNLFAKITADFTDKKRLT
jgi:hypothetical protein